MLLKKWEKLPVCMQNEEVRRYYDLLRKKQCSLFFKRLFDIVLSLLMLIALSPLFLILSVLIKIDSPGPIFYRQVRITQYGKRFNIHKFRSMTQNADSGLPVTLSRDERVTGVGRVIRRFRIDEISQLLDILRGNMTFVGTRPEVPKYTEKYTSEMLATLLLPAGVTSIASIFYKDEAELLGDADDADAVYEEQVLPAKMRYNLRSIERFSLWGEMKIMLMTVLAVFGKEYRDTEADAAKAREKSAVE